MEISTLIRNRRKELKMSQRELAEKSGITPEHVLHIEHGQHTPNLKTAINILDALGMEISVRRKRG